MPYAIRVQTRVKHWTPVRGRLVFRILGHGLDDIEATHLHHSASAKLTGMVSQGMGVGGRVKPFILPKLSFCRSGFPAHNAFGSSNELCTSDPELKGSRNVNCVCGEHGNTLSDQYGSSDPDGTCWDFCPVCRPRAVHFLLGVAPALPNPQAPFGRHQKLISV